MFLSILGVNAEALGRFSFSLKEI